MQHYLSQLQQSQSQQDSTARATLRVVTQRAALDRQRHAAFTGSLRTLIPCGEVITRMPEAARQM